MWPRVRGLSAEAQRRPHRIRSSSEVRTDLSVPIWSFSVCIIAGCVICIPVLHSDDLLSFIIAGLTRWHDRWFVSSWQLFFIIAEIIFFSFVPFFFSYQKKVTFYGIRKHFSLKTSTTVIFQWFRIENLLSIVIFLWRETQFCPFKHLICFQHLEWKGSIGIVYWILNEFCNFTLNKHDFAFKVNIWKFLAGAVEDKTANRQFTMVFFTL